MEISVEPSKTYAVTTSGSCTVTDADGLELCTASSGSQAFFVATTPTVTISDDGAKVSRATFNYALAVAGLLGGGADKLPAGYTRVAFLAAPQGGVGIDIDYVPTGQSGFHTEFEVNNSTAQYQHVLSSCGVRYNADGSVAGTDTLLFTPHLNNAAYKFFAAKIKSDGSSWTYTKYNPFPFNQKLQADFNWRGDLMVRATGQGDGQIPEGLMVRNGVQTWLFSMPESPNQSLHGRIYSADISEGSRTVRSFVPAIDRKGVCCMYETVRGRTYRSCTNAAPAAGIDTLSQLDTLLRNLPATGGELTLSLPAEANTPEVAEALQACHDSKGWTLTVHEYRPAEASTYSLRRVRNVAWCRRELSEYGSYVDADGFRWQIDRCAAIFGPHGQDPTDYGYDPFDSVEQAAEEWGLVPYVDPNAEELSTAE